MEPDPVRELRGLSGGMALLGGAVAPVSLLVSFWAVWMRHYAWAIVLLVAPFGCAAVLWLMVLRVQQPSRKRRLGSVAIGMAGAAAGMVVLAGAYGIYNILTT